MKMLYLGRCKRLPVLFKPAPMFIKTKGIKYTG
jgi:hypothetical protein